MRIPRKGDKPKNYFLIEIILLILIVGVILVIKDGNYVNFDISNFSLSNFSLKRLFSKSDYSIIGEESISKGDSTILTLADRYGTPREDIIWESSDTSIATVDSNGNVTAVNEGKVTITATTSEGREIELPIEVYIVNEHIDVKSIEITGKNTVDVGKTIVLKGTVSPSNATYKTITWSTSDKDIATVNNGKVTGIKAGKVIITAQSSNGKSKTFDITVKDVEVIEDVSVTSISIDGDDKINVGEYTQLLATIKPKTATNKNIVWSSSDETIATVTSYGKVLGISNGTVTITATSDGKEDKFDIKVNKVEEVIPVEEITLLSVNNILVGESFIISPTIKPSNATNKLITWTSSDSKIVSVDQNGKITGNKVGNATITANCDGKSETIKIYVTEPIVYIEVTDITITGLTSVEVNKTIKLTGTIIPSNATNKTITWSSSDTSIATVNNGEVAGIKTGNVTITASSGGISKTYNISVYKVDNVIPVTSIKITGNNSLKVGETIKLTTTITPSNATNKTVNYTSSDTNIATIDNNGNLNGKNPGTVTITAKCGDKTDTYTVTINSVNVNVNGIKIDGYSMVNAGSNITLTATITPTNATNKEVIWESSDTSIATIDSNGKVSGIKAGYITITCTSKENSSIKATKRILVTQEVNSISFENIIDNLNVGKSYQLKVVFNPSNASDQTIIWTSSDIKVATVANGIVTGISSGTVTITAKTSNNKSVSVKINITKVLTENNIETYSELCDYLVNTKKVKSIDYKSFVDKKSDLYSSVTTAKGTPATINDTDIRIVDDYYAIKEAHKCANKNNLPVSVTKGTYNIYKYSGEESIPVGTSTNLNFSTINIHDYQKGIVTNMENQAHIYDIGYYDANSKGYDISSEFKGKLKTLSSSLASDKKVLDIFKGYENLLVKVTNKNQLRYCRIDGIKRKLECQAEEQTEVFTVKNGVIQNDVEWDYTNITSLKVTKIPDETVEFKNAYFYNLYDSKNKQYLLTDKGERSKRKINRGIKVSRSNTTVSKVDHAFLDPTTRERVDVIYFFYHHFLIIGNAEYGVANVSFKESMVTPRRYLISENATSTSTNYELGYGNAVNLYFYKIYEYQSQYEYELEHPSYYNGMTNSNLSKDIVYDTCRLNRYDAHIGVHNLTIKNSKIYTHGITCGAGSGTLLLDNDTIVGKSNIIKLREDYGGTFNGTIKIKNCTIKAKEANSIITVLRFGWEYGYVTKNSSGNLEVTNKNYIHNYYYDLYLPKIEIDGLTIKNGSKLYIVYNNSSATGEGVYGDFSNVNKFISNKFYSGHSGKVNSTFKIDVSGVKSSTYKNIKGVSSSNINLFYCTSSKSSCKPLTSLVEEVEEDDE